MSRSAGSDRHRPPASRRAAHVPRIVRTLLLSALALGRPAAAVEMPWREAGWTAEEAAAHLLSRFAYGARPGEVEAVAADPEAWFEAQLAATRPEPALTPRLARLRTLALPAAEHARRYPGVGALVQEAQAAGLVPPKLAPAELDGAQRAALRAKVMELASERGYRGVDELLGELVEQKLLRAVYAENQLREVMTDFWVNHFNVSVDDSVARPWVLSYERDAIRPHALGSFRDLLGATARHPAMLFYLDNAQSTAAPDGGRNENYARELLELHTLGDRRAFTERDVVETARAFTGWSVVPAGADAQQVATLATSPAAAHLGFVVEAPFLFRPRAHDAGRKSVLGRRLPAGRGIEDGEEVLGLLARHPATARHLARKLAVRFVSDRPPPALVDRLAAAWRAGDGDLRPVLRALVASPELWAPEARAAKVKTPLELAVSAVRALGAQLARGRQLASWVGRMGQPLYAWPQPSGFPDEPAQWLHAGALLQRMGFALALADGRVEGVLVDLERTETPESLWARLVPGRPLGADAREALAAFADGPAPPARLVGVLLASPEFQRR